jgi:hypothetical protein
MSEFKVGQEVLLRSYGRYARPDRTVTVTRVGRKWVYVGNSAFSAETGKEKDGYASHPNQIGTPEMFAERDSRDAAEKRIRDLTRSYGWVDKLPTEALTKIADLIEAEVIEP